MGDFNRAAGGLDTLPWRLNRRTAFRFAGLAGMGVVAAACSSGGNTGGTTSPTSAAATGSASSGASGTFGATSAAASSASPSSVAAVTSDAATVAILDAIFDKTFAATGLTGMAAGVWMGSNAWQRSAWLRGPFHQGAVPAGRSRPHRQYHQVVHRHCRPAAGGRRRRVAGRPARGIRDGGCQRIHGDDQGSAGDDLGYLRLHLGREVPRRL